jgi:cytochrome c554/c'-like protein
MGTSGTLRGGVAVGLILYAACTDGEGATYRTSRDGDETPSNPYTDLSSTLPLPDGHPPLPDDAPIPAPPSTGGPPPPTLPPSVFKSSKVCSTCHDALYNQWSGSMHMRALTSPLMIAETNQAVRGPYANVSNPDPKRFCVNCHSPSAARVTTGATLPLGDEATLWKEGIGCQTCHQFAGKPTNGGGGYSNGFMKDLAPGGTVFGPLANPAQSTAHASARADGFDRPNTMCGNCHNVNFDLDGDGRIEKGRDLVLQQTWDEYVIDYRQRGGGETCISCHMPVVPGLFQATNKPGSPTREVHDHSFLGVDYSLDDLAQREATRPSRTALLRDAARLRVEQVAAAGGRVSFSATITNASTGHNLPTGFAFVRQMWLEVRAFDVGGSVIASSGVLGSPAADLCEAEVLDEDNPLATFVRGCEAGVDSSLVHFQQKLVDRVERVRVNGEIVRDALDQPVLEAAPGGREVLVQFLKGGVVARRRPIDGATLGLLRPLEARSFAYDLPTNGATTRSLSVRLLFRSVAPYFVRGLAADPTKDVPGLETLDQNLEVVEMANVTVDVNQN